MKRVIGACLTLALHGAFLASVLVSCHPSSQPPPPKPPEPAVAADEPVMILTATQDTGSMLCQSSYDGIGLAGMDNGRVWMVAEGAPAWKAGIREGDILRGLGTLYPGKFPVGTRVWVDKQVGTRWVRLWMKIEKICRD